MGERMELSVVIPVFNEADNLDELVERCLAACRATGKTFEIILVDDGSTDNSPEKIEQASQASDGRVVGVFLNRNYGQHAAIMAGFDDVRGDVIVTLDADLQNPPEEIPRLVAAIEKGFDVVGTIRKFRQDSWFRRTASGLVNLVVQKSTGVLMNDYGCMLRAYRRHIVEAMRCCSERSTFIPILANSFARTTTEIEVAHDARQQGASKYTLLKLMTLLFDLLTSMTTFPLRLLSILGGIISITGIGFGVFLLAMRLAHGPAWAAEGVFTLFAILFIFIGAVSSLAWACWESISGGFITTSGRARDILCSAFPESLPARSTEKNDHENDRTGLPQHRMRRD